VRFAGEAQTTSVLSANGESPAAKQVAEANSSTHTCQKGCMTDSQKDLSFMGKLLLAPETIYVYIYDYVCIEQGRLAKIGSSTAELPDKSIIGD
jgi:hypothetical protein